ncbi:MAG: hypothetical protein GY861_04290, partial [bacterium]|nr:hypothetical protein [bacterium]
MAGNISPESAYPFTISNPSSKRGGSTLVFTIILSTGLAYKQFIAVQLPSVDAGTSGANLGTGTWKFNTSAYASCALYKDASTTLSMTFVPSATGEENIAYCRLDSTTNVPLVANTKYTFKLTLANSATQLVNAIFLRSVDIFTSTSATSIGVKVDTGYGFASGVIFADYQASGNQLLKIEEIKKVDSSGADDTTSTYQYGTFSFRVKFKSYSLLRWGPSAILWFDFPSSSLVGTLPTAVTSTDVDSTVTLKKKLAGSLKLTKASSTAIVITGVTGDWLPKDREFNLQFTGTKAGDGAVTAQKLTVKLFYSNYSLINSWTDKDFVSITKGSITLTAAHPEAWEIYMGGAWPTNFTFKVTSTIDLAPTNGAYVVLRHSKLIPGFEVFNFVASSCDFSANSEGFTFAWGTRTVCYPLSPDLEVANVTAIGYSNALATTDSTSQLGSGIFFKMTKLTQNISYQLLVWGVADVCGQVNRKIPVGGGDADPLQSGKAATTALKFSFSINVYKSIDQTLRGPARFVAADVIATGSTSDGPKCYSAFRGESISLDSGSPVGLGAFYEVYTGKAGTDLNGTNAPGAQAASPTVSFQQPSSTVGEQNQYKEFADWAIIKAPLDPTPALTAGYVFDVTAAAASENIAQSSWLANGAYGWFVDGSTDQYKPSFLFTATTTQQTIGTTNAFVLRGDFAYGQGPQTTAGSFARQALPLPIIFNDTAAGQNTYGKMFGTPNGKFELYFSKAWFTYSTKVIGACTTSFNVGVSANKVHASGGAALIAYNPGSCPTCKGLFKAIFLLDTSPVQTKDWIASPGAAGTNSANMDNYYILNDTVDSNSSSIPTSSTTKTIYKIASVDQSTANTSPGGDKWTICPTCLGYITNAAAHPTGTPAAVPGATNQLTKCAQASGPTDATCIWVFNIYTNCLKWISTAPTVKTLFSSIDVVFRFKPQLASGTVGPNGPSRTIRFIKLFPEAQVFQDVSVKQQGSSGNPLKVWWNPTVAESQTTYQGWGGMCLVELDQAHIGTLGTTSVNVLAVWINNMSLIDVDASDASATYPVGSLTSGISAWGYPSVPGFSAYGQMGGVQGVATSFKPYTTSTGTTLSVGIGAAGLTHMRIATQSGGTSATVLLYDAATSYALPVNGASCTNGRSTYQFLMSSVVLFTGVTAASPIVVVTNAKTSTTTNLFIPAKCPTGTSLTGAVGYNSATGAVPTAYAATFAATDVKTFTSVQKILQSKESTKEYTILTDTSIEDRNGTIPASGNTIPYGVSKVTARWIDYTSTTTDVNKMFAFRNSSGAITRYFGCSIFLASDIDLETAANGVGFGTASAATTSNVMAYYAPTTTKYFYIQGVKLSKALSVSVSPVGSLASNAKVDIFGVLRPAISVFSVSTATTSTSAFSFNNKVLVTCADPTKVAGPVPSPTTADGALITSASFSSATATVVFQTELTFAADTTTGGTLAAAIDIGTNYSSDDAATIKFTVTLPSTFQTPKYTQLNVKSTDLITTNAICILADGSNPGIVCSTSGGVATCDLAASGSVSFTVCCYNVKISKADPTITDSYVVLNGITSINSSYSSVAYLNKYIPTAVAYTFANTEAANGLQSALTATLGTPEYSPKQLNALGTALFYFTLPRDIIPNG